MNPAFRWRLLAAFVSFLSCAGVVLGEAPRVLEPGTRPADARLGAPRKLDDKYHAWTPPATLEAWEAMKPAIRERMLVGMGLWPMPAAAPLKPVIHGKIDRDDYTVEKVYFESYPGFYVTGNLYRPKKTAGKAPGVLCPHGHWQNGRFYELAADKAKTTQIDIGAEKFLSGARFPLQARMVGLARMGCVVFHYDMVGVADSQQIGHTQGFLDVEAALRLQDFMGLQTFNSIRALDFLTALPDVDPTRIGVTGASGGGTQTFSLCALDPRPTVAFPAVMVSTDMQGGCICENCSYLRIGINNIALTALFAPKPLAMSGANDWTIDIETRGLPELKQIYGLYGKADLVHAKAFPQFDHNYNQVAREMMYAWFNRHLKLGLKEPVEERDFQPVPPPELSVYDAGHLRPGNAVNGTELREHMTRTSDEQLAALLPKDAAGLAEFRKVVGAAARVMLDSGVPEPRDVVGASKVVETVLPGGVRLFRVSASRRDAGEQIPIVALIPDQFSGTAVVWIDGAGKRHLFDDEGKPSAAVARLLAAGRAVVSADVFMTGEFLADGSEAAPPPEVNQRFAPYTFCYNRPRLSNRVRDILTLVGGLGKYDQFKTLHLVGTGEAGPWVALARALAGSKIDRCAADLRGFSFRKVLRVDDPMLLPGGLKYGNIAGLAALAAPAELTLYGTQEIEKAELQPLAQVYRAAAGKLKLESGSLSDEQVAEMFSK